MHPQIQPGARCDLHLHTNRSDGRLTPSELIDNAIESRLDIIALTDHDLTSNIGTVFIGGTTKAFMSSTAPR